MRTVVAGFHGSSLLLLILLLFVGCSGGGSDEPEAYTKETGPPVEGMVWNESAEAWEFPAPSGGYDRDSYDDGYDDDGYGGTSNDEVADRGDADEDGYADSGADNGEGNDDAYASSGGSADDSVDDSYGANDYGGGDSIQPPADLNEQRERAREAARNQGGSGDYAEAGYDAYASTDGYGTPGPDGRYGAPGGAGGNSTVYQDQIEPLLRAHCYNCHGGGPRGNRGDLQLHNPTAIADSGTVVAYKPDDSELYYRITLEPGDEQRMPPRGRGLSTQEVALIKKWIEDGANYGSGGQGAGGTDPYANSGRGDDDDGYGDADSDYDQANRGPAPPSNLAEAASVSFQRGDDLAAMNQLYAQSLLNKSDVAKKVLDSYQYFPLRRRASLAVRWGIGVTYKTKYGFEGAPRPPGVNQEVRGVDEADPHEAYESLQITNDALDYYTGDLGDELIIRLRNRIERGDYGPILKAELEKRLAGDVEDSFDNEGVGYDDGGYGRSSGSINAGSGRSSERPDDDEITPIMPGVVMLGQADRSTLFERAVEQGVDALLAIDVFSEADRRQRIVNSEFRVRLYDVSDPKTVLATTNKIKNVDLQKKRAEDPADETIQLQLDPVFDAVDKGTTVKDKKFRPFKVVKFPDNTSDKAKASILQTVRALLKNKEIAPLAKLSEIKFYESRGLMSDKHAAKAFEVIDSEKAKQLTTVSDEIELQDLLAEWLIVDDSGSDEDDEEDTDRPRPRRRREFR